MCSGEQVGVVSLYQHLYFPSHRVKYFYVFDIVLTLHRDKLYDRTKEIRFLSFEDIVKNKTQKVHLVGFVVLLYDLLTPKMENDQGALCEDKGTV